MNYWSEESYTVAPGSVKSGSEDGQTGFQSQKHYEYSTHIPVSFRWSSRPHQRCFLSLSYHTRLASDSFATGTPHGLPLLLIFSAQSLYLPGKATRLLWNILWNSRWELYDRSHITFLLHRRQSFIQSKKLKPGWICNCPYCESTNLTSIHSAPLLSAKVFKGLITFKLLPADKPQSLTCSWD